MPLLLTPLPVRQQFTLKIILMNGLILPNHKKLHFYLKYGQHTYTQFSILVNKYSHVATFHFVVFSKQPVTLQQRVQKHFEIYTFSLSLIAHHDGGIK